MNTHSHYEITLRVILLSILLAFLLAVSNAYLALKIGILTSASIPAAMISMGILRFFKNSTIYENNLVQTAASAGEAIAGGIVYTIPALIIIHYWSHFNYWENFLIAFVGSGLGILFSIPLRRVLMTAEHLSYPEGRAIAEVLQIGAQGNLGLAELLWGGFAGAIIEFLQTGLQWVANSFQFWWKSSLGIMGFGIGFSPTMLGVGYLIGFNVGLSILLGAVIGWVFGVPALTFFNLPASGIDAAQTVALLFAHKIRYIGIGAMLIAGLWTLTQLIKPFYQSLRSSLDIFIRKNQSFYNLPTKERDIPMQYVLMGIGLLSVITFWLLYDLFPVNGIGFIGWQKIAFIIGSLGFILIIGFIFAALCGYFSGLVGVTASPGSAIVIAGLLLSAFIIRLLVSWQHASLLLSEYHLSAAAITIIIGAIVTGIAAIANDNIQDLKVGHIIGSTPWKQQVMLMLGALVSCAVIPLTMNLLFSVYGIADVLPSPHMDPLNALPAPTSALMAAITQGVFNASLPWKMMLTGGILSLIFILLNYRLRARGKTLSILGIAIGIYLPLSTSMPLFLGSLFSLLTEKALQRRSLNAQNTDLASAGIARQHGLLLACGLVAGSALMDVLLAIPFAISRNPNLLRISYPYLAVAAPILSLLITCGLGIWFYRSVTRAGAGDGNRTHAISLGS